MAITRYYPKRQVIDVSDFETIDFGEDILICVPRFAWIVARSFLSVQGSWMSSYAVEHFPNGYETPTLEQKDTIDANIARFLGETDMSCDLEAAILLLVDQVEAIANKVCDIALSCAAGSGGAGGSEAEGVEYNDNGTDPPFGFDDYPEYDAYKCAMAHLLVDWLREDMVYLQRLELAQFSAALLAAAIMSPIPGDEVASLVGVLITIFVEGTIDAVLDDIIDAVDSYGDELVCEFFLATNPSTAANGYTAWKETYLSTGPRFLLSWFSSNDAMNQLFVAGNQLFGSGSCAGCSDPSEVRDSFTDGDYTQLVAHTPEEGGPWMSGVGNWQILDEKAKSIGSAGSRIFIDGNVSDIIVSADLTPTSGGNKTANQGIIARASDSNNYVSGGWVGGSNSGYWIARREAGVRTEHEFVSAPATYETRTLRLRCVGTSISLDVNGVPMLSHTTSFNETETECGMTLGEANGSRFDNFLAQPPL